MIADLGPVLEDRVDFNLVSGGRTIPVGWGRVMSRDLLRAPRRPRLFREVSVPLPGEAGSESAPAG